MLHNAKSVARDARLLKGLAIGRDSGDPVSREYSAGFPYTGGQILKVIYDVGDDAYIDMEKRLGAILARD